MIDSRKVEFGELWVVLGGVGGFCMLCDVEGGEM